MVTLLGENPKVSMVYSNAHLVSETQEILGVKRTNERLVENIIPEILNRGRAWATSSCLWNRAVINNISWLPNRVWEDYAFDTSVAIKNNFVKGTKEKLVYYDVSGMDKISKNVNRDSIIEKGKSIQFVSKTLRASSFKEDAVVLNKICHYLINNCIQLLEEGTHRHSVFKGNIAEIKKWNPNFKGFIFQFIVGLYTKFAIRLLRKIRKKYF